MNLRRPELRPRSDSGLSLVVALALALAALFTQLVQSSHPTTAPTPGSVVARELASLASARPPAPDHAVTSPRAASLATDRVVVHRQTDEAPSWAVAYGKEFWRRPVNQDDASATRRSSTTLPAPVNLGDVIERVSHAFTRETDSESPRVDAKTFSTTLDGAGLRFSPHRAAVDPDPTTEMRWRTLAVRSGEQALFQAATGMVPWSVMGNTAQGLLNGSVGLIEHYEARGEGVEVSWVFQQRPTGGEGLEIEAELTGLSYAGETGHGHHFADPAGTARVRIGAVTLVDARGARTEVPCAATGDRWRVRVPAATLATAEFPIAIDPLLSPEFGMDEPVLSFSRDSSQDPAIASNGSEYLAVWTDGRGANGYLLFGARISRDGAVLDPRGLPLNITDGGTLYPAVASNGRDFLVVWRAGFTGGSILGTRVTREGAALDTPTFLRLGYSSAHPRPSVASDGTNYMVVWEHAPDANGDEDLFGARVTPTGHVLDVPSLILYAAPGRQRSPALAWNGSVFLMVWDDDTTGIFNDDTFGARVGSDGTVLDPGGFQVGPGAPGIFPTPAVASDGRDFLVAAGAVAVRVSGSGAVTGVVGLPVEGIPAVACNGTDYLVVVQSGQARAVLVGGDGTVRATGSLLSRPGEFNSAGRPAVASVGRDFFVVVEDRTLSNGHILGARVTGDGAVVAREIPVSTDWNSQLGPAVASNGRDYLVVWNDYRFVTLRDIYGVRLDSQGAVLDLSALPIRRGAGLEDDPAVASDGRDYFVVWQEYRGGNSWRIHGGRVTRDGAVLDPEGVDIRTNGTDPRAPAVASNGRDYLVAWTEWSGSRDTFYDVHGARIGSDATVLDPGSFLISHRPNHEFAPAVASDGTDYLVTWHGWATEAHPRDEVFAARVTSAGIVADPDGFPLTTSTNFCTFPAVAYNGAAYLVVWPEQVGYANTDIRGTRVSTAGAVLDSPALAINSAAGTQLYPAVASDGRDFLLVWSDQRRGRPEVFGARVTGAGQVLESEGFLLAETGAPYEVPPAIAHNGRRYLAAYAVRDADAGFRTRGRFIEFTLPPPWQDVDVGRPGLVGGAGFSNGTFTVNAAGTNIWGRADAFHFVHQTLTGDGQIIARIASLGNTHPRAKAGVMLRDGLMPTAKYSFLGATPDRHAVFQARLNDGGRTFQVERNGSVPLWVRLVRRGSTCVGYQSTNGLNWRFVWFAWVNLPASVQAGLAVTAHDDSELNTATFDAVSVTPRLPTGGLAAEALDPLAPEVSLTAPSATDAGSRLHISGIAGRYVIEASSDLSHWTILGSAANTDGAVEFTDHDAANQSRRFYRARWEEP